MKPKPESGTNKNKTPNNHHMTSGPHDKWKQQENSTEHTLHGKKLKNNDVLSAFAASSATAEGEKSATLNTHCVVRN